MGKHHVYRFLYNPLMTQQTVLIIDDDPHILELLRYALETEGLAVAEAKDGREGLFQVQQHQPNVIILDVMMPEMSGLEMCRELRKTSQIPILFLSSRDSEIDKILGLELGGDDYVSKPFSPRELVARIKAMLRRQTIAAPASPILKQGNVTLHPDRFQVFCQNEPVILTTTEYNLLETFMASPQRVFSRDALVQAEIFKDVVSDRTIDSHIRRLRLKFTNAGCPNVIETAHGFGYKLGNCQ